MCAVVLGGERFRESGLLKNVDERRVDFGMPSHPLAGCCNANEFWWCQNIRYQCGTVSLVLAPPKFTSVATAGQGMG